MFARDVFTQRKWPLNATGQEGLVGRNGGMGKFDFF